MKGYKIDLTEDFPSKADSDRAVKAVYFFEKLGFKCYPNSLNTPYIFAKKDSGWLQSRRRGDFYNDKEYEELSFYELREKADRYNGAPFADAIEPAGEELDFKLDLVQLSNKFDERFLQAPKGGIWEVTDRIAHKKGYKGYPEGSKRKSRYVYLYEAPGGERRIQYTSKDHFNYTLEHIEPTGIEFFEGYESLITGEKTMSNNTTRVLNLLDDAFKLVSVSYDHLATPEDHPATYDFKAPKDLVLSVGDVVVVPSKNQGFKVVVVIDDGVENEIEIKEDMNYSWVVGSVDLETYNACIDRDKKLRKLIQAKEKKAEQDKVKAFMKERLGIESIESLTLPSIKSGADDEQ